MGYQIVLNDLVELVKSFKFFLTKNRYFNLHLANANKNSKVEKHFQFFLFLIREVATIKPPRPQKIFQKGALTPPTPGYLKFYFGHFLLNSLT